MSSKGQMKRPGRARSHGCGHWHHDLPIGSPAKLELATMGRCRCSGVI